MPPLELPPGVAQQANEHAQVAMLLLNVSTNILTSLIGPQRLIDKTTDEWSEQKGPSKRELVDEAVEYAAILIETVGIARFNRRQKD